MWRRAIGNGKQFVVETGSYLLESPTLHFHYLYTIHLMLSLETLSLKPVTCVEFRILEDQFSIHKRGQERYEISLRGHRACKELWWVVVWYSKKQSTLSVQEVGSNPDRSSHNIECILQCPAHIWEVEEKQVLKYTETFTTEA